MAGAAGFLGSHLVERLLRQGHEVVGVDNYRTGFKSNLHSEITDTEFELIRHDITFPLYLEVDAIYNLASPASPKHYQRDPVQTLKTNVLGTINLLGLAKRLQVPFVQASTSEVYGDPKEHPQVEEYWGNVNPIGPRACYDEGKRAAESVCSDYHRMFGLEVGIARIFNTYGPKMAPDDGRVVSEFITSALQDKPLKIFGDGTQTRSFCYVGDTISGLILIMEKGLASGPINIGNPIEHTVLDLAKLIIELTGSNSSIEFHDLPENDPVRRKPSISKAQQLLGWSPTVQLDEGLKETARYFSLLLPPEEK